MKNHLAAESNEGTWGYFFVVVRRATSSAYCYPRDNLIVLDDR